MDKVYTSLKNISFKVWRTKGLIVIASFAIILFSLSVVGVHGTKEKSDAKVLGLSSKSTTSATPTPTPTISPTPTPVRLVRVTSTPTPTETPIPTPTPTSVPSNNSKSESIPTPTSEPTPTPTLSPTPTPTPIPAEVNVQIGVDYAGEKDADSYTVTIALGQTAWDAVVKAIGEGNIEYTDYGGDLGKFITAFNGISAASNQYFEFRVNGVSSNVGVSSYVCREEDKLDFVLTTF